jgi:hypothetical protein
VLPIRLQCCVYISPPSPLFSLQPAAHHPPPARRASRLAAHAD